MDRFSEQLLKKQPSGRDMLIRGLYIAAALVILAGTVLIFYVFSALLAVTLAAAAIWGLIWLLQGTSIEYEYIVTNDDLDIDKIMGRRKRKRLITVSLSSVKSLSAYESGGEIGADVTVMAHDETGEGMYCLICDTKEYGELAVVFNPDAHTLYNMIGGFSPAVKSKYDELYQSVTPADEDSEEDTENDSGEEMQASEEREAEASESSEE